VVRHCLTSDLPLLPSTLLYFSSAALDLPALHSFPTRRSSDLHLEAPGEGLHDLHRGIAQQNNRGRFHNIGPAPGAHGLEGHVRRSEEHTSELQSRFDLVCRLLLEKKNK